MSNVFKKCQTINVMFGFIISNTNCILKCLRGTVKSVKNLGLFKKLGNL